MTSRVVPNELNRRVADFVAVLDALDMAKALYWGSSMGGCIGFGIAKYAQEKECTHW